MNVNYEALSDYFLKLIPSSKLFQTVFTLISIIFLMSIAFTTKASATESQHTAPDAQKIWDKSCFTCHGDSADIARNHLKVVDGELQGPMHKDTFRKFLTNHYLSKTKADAVYSMLLTQANNKTRFEKECGSCHESAKELVQSKLELNRGVLFSKESTTPTYGFLETHQDLNRQDVSFFMKQLTVIGYEIYLPRLTE